MIDIDVEKTILYYIIIEKEEFILSEKDFTDKINQKIIKAINELKAQKSEISMLSIKNKIDSKSQEL